MPPCDVRCDSVNFAPGFHGCLFCTRQPTRVYHSPLGGEPASLGALVSGAAAVAAHLLAEPAHKSHPNSEVLAPSVRHKRRCQSNQVAPQSIIQRSPLGTVLPTEKRGLPAGRPCCQAFSQGSLAACSNWNFVVWPPLSGWAFSTTRFLQHAVVGCLAAEVHANTLSGRKPK